MNDTSLISPAYTNTLDQLTAIENMDDGYSQHVKHFVKWCRAQDLEVCEDTVHDYFVYLNTEAGYVKKGAWVPYTAGTIRIKRSVIKKRIRQLLKDAPLDDQIRLDRVLSELDHFGETAAPKINSIAVTKDMIISPLEVEQILAKATKRISLMIKFLLATGCRVAELTGARVGRCEKQGRFVNILVKGKGSKDRTVKIRTELYDQIRDTYRGEEFLFETEGCYFKGKWHGPQQYDKIYITTQISKLGRKVLNRKISAHCLRHTFATRMIERFPSKIDAISKYLGHSSVSITLDLYCHTQLSDDDLDFIAEVTI